MKKIVTNVTPEVNMNSLTGKELIAYKCKNSLPGTYSVAVLSKLTPHSYGFIALDYSTSNPRYESSSWQASVKLAGENRQLYAFNDLQDLAKAIVEKKIQ